MWIQFDVDLHGCGQGSLALMLSLFSGDASSPQDSEATLEDGECP